MALCDCASSFELCTDTSFEMLNCTEGNFLIFISFFFCETRPKKGNWKLVFSLTLFNVCHVPLLMGLFLTHCRRLCHATGTYRLVSWL